MATISEVMKSLNKKEKIIGGAREVPTGHGGFSTGLIGLDRHFKTRGIPRGRWTMIVAENNAGKCLVAGTYVWTDRGLETIAEVYQRLGYYAGVAPKTFRLDQGTLSFMNENQSQESAVALISNGYRPTFRLTLESGRSIEATSNHPLRVLNDEGWIVWKQVSNIEPGDVIVSATFGLPEVSQEDGGITTDEAEFLGYIVADGCLSRKNKVMYAKTFDDVRERFEELSMKLFNIKPLCYDGVNMHLNSKALREILEERFGIGLVKAADKEIPYAVRTGGAEIIRSYLYGYLEGDFYLDPSGNSEILTASPRMAEQLQVLLLGCGVPTTKTIKKVTGYEQNYYRIQIGVSATDRLMSFIGIPSARRQAQFDRRRTAYGESYQSENIPNLFPIIRSLAHAVGGTSSGSVIPSNQIHCLKGVDCSISRLRKILNYLEEASLPVCAQPMYQYLRFLLEAGYTYERVTSVEDAGRQPTFDVSLNDTHSFIANGVVSHNSNFAMQVAAVLHRDVDAGVQKRGVTIYCDSENTFDPDYAMILGMDVRDTSFDVEDFDPDKDKLLVMRPEDGIEWLDAVEQLIKTGQVDLIILDSLTFLVPRAMLEADPGKNLPAVQARQNSMLVLRLTGLIARYNVAMVVVNHLTGTMKSDYHGNPILEIRGGDMVKNAMSVIIWMKKSSLTIDEKGRPLKKADMNDSVGADITFELYKNKLGRQNYRVPGRFIFGQGFDVVYDLVQTAFDTEVVTKKGAWCYMDEQKWNGENALMAELAESIDLREEITRRIYATQES